MRLPAHVLQTLTDRLGAEELRRALLPYPDSETTETIARAAGVRPRDVRQAATALRDGAAGEGAGGRFYFVLNKPSGCHSQRSNGLAGAACASRLTVYDCLHRGFPAVPHVGRLDRDTEGLLLFTDDGALANALIHGDGGGMPHATKRYLVEVTGLLKPRVGGTGCKAEALQPPPPPAGAVGPLPPVSAGYPEAATPHKKRERGSGGVGGGDAGGGGVGGGGSRIAACGTAAEQLALLRAPLHYEAQKQTRTHARTRSARTHTFTHKHTPPPLTTVTTTITAVAAARHTRTPPLGARAVDAASGGGAPPRAAT